MEPDDFSFLRGLAQPEKKKRKRGGLAGIWDRNKNIITPLATGLAGAIGTPAAGAALGAAIGGLDRPGKRGIGFDVRGATKGALSGAAMGNIGSGLKSGLGKIFGSKLPAVSELPASSTLQGSTAVGKPQSVQLPGATQVPALKAQLPYDGAAAGQPGGSWGRQQIFELDMSAARAPLREVPALSSRKLNMAPTEVPSNLPSSSVSPPAMSNSSLIGDVTVRPNMMERMGEFAGNIGGATTRGLGKLLQSPEGLGMSLQALSGVMSAQAQRRLEEQRLREERRRAENFARLAMPLYVESMGRR